MLGRQAPEDLPPEIAGSLCDLCRRAAGKLGPVRFEGVVLVGHVGVTSHFGDLLRRARIPSRIEEPVPPGH